MSTPFADRLHGAVEATGTPIVVGLDPHLTLLPEEDAVARDAGAPRAERAAAMERFLLEIVDLCAGAVPAVKPQAAFFEVLGADGFAAFERVVAAAKGAGLLVIGDVKRGDIGSTAAAYAEACLSGAERSHMCDAATVNPYLGSDSITPFVDACRAADAGIYVLVRTSNPGGADLQALELADGGNVAEHMARAVAAWGADLVGESGWSSVGAVVGATHPAELGVLRELMPRAPLLLPGYGAQGGTAEGLAAAFSDGPHGALVNSSRGILFAHAKDASGGHWKDASARAIAAMREDLAPLFRS